MSVDKGCVLILSNPRSTDDNKGKVYEQDAKRMVELWSTTLKCDLFGEKAHLNKSAVEMMWLLKELSTTDAKLYRYAVVVIIGQGELKKVKEEKQDFYTYKPCFYGYDGKEVYECNMLSQFYNDKSGWHGKHKIFILCYPRYLNKKDSARGAAPTSDLIESMEIDVKLAEVFGKSLDEEFKGQQKKIDPTISDFLLVYGLNDNLPQIICDVFSKSYNEMPVTDMLTQVNAKMSRADDDWYRGRMSVFESSSCERLYLRGPVEPNEESMDVEENRSMDRIEKVLRMFGSTENTHDTASALALLMSEPNSDETVEFIKDKFGLRPKRGYALILCNSLKPKSIAHEQDSDMMTRLWKDTLGCKLHKDRSHTNKSGNEMKMLLQEVAEVKSDGYDYLVVIISSHGALKREELSPANGESKSVVFRSVFQGHGSGLVEERLVLQCLSDTDSEWRNKTKIFIFDSCRGNRIDEGVEEKATPPALPYPVDGERLPPSITAIATDSFIIHATHPEFKAYAGHDGSRLIKAVKEVFRKNWYKQSITAMLTDVNRKMKNKGDKKAMSVFKSTATSEFRLNQN